ncbi:MAG: hypothetical protein OEX05_09895 [Chloroflexota bacterium]|jgi:hypothetical protein|nr:hypothetical protein [Chloroflexota bacterium]
MGDDDPDEFTCQGCGRRIPFGLHQVSFKDRVGGALAEVGFEDGGQGESTTRASTPLTVSLRRHRR